MIDESDIAKRKSLDEPAGLKNVGNTCWFNSIVQSLYTLPYFRQLILNFQCPTINHSLTDSVSEKIIHLYLFSSMSIEQEQQALYFTEELRYLFALMLKSPRRSINPDRAIKKFKNTRKLCGVDFSHEVNEMRQEMLKKNLQTSLLGLFGICNTSYRSCRTCV